MLVYSLCEYVFIPFCTSDYTNIQTHIHTSYIRSNAIHTNSASGRNFIVLCIDRNGNRTAWYIHTETLNFPIRYFVCSVLYKGIRCVFVCLLSYLLAHMFPHVYGIFQIIIRLAFIVVSIAYRIRSFVAHIHAHIHIAWLLSVLLLDLV